MRLLKQLTILSVALACGWFAITKANAEGTYFKTDYPAASSPDGLQTPVTYTLWIPENAPKLRGVIVHQHGAGTTASIEGSTAANDLHWQALAKKWDCALLGPSYHVQNEKIDLSPGGSELWFDPRKGSEKTFLRALHDLGTQSGHPELETIPWALWGHSGGGIWSDVMTTLHPDRVIAVWLRSGSAAMFRSKPEFPQPEIPSAAYTIPTMCNPGAKELGPRVGTLATFQEYRLKGAPIGFAPDPRTGHECGDSRYLAIPFFDACLAMRLPEKGGDQTLKPVDMNQAWLAPLEGVEAKPAGDFKGNPNVAVWLPNAAVAKAWVEYVKTGAVSDTTPPPAPFHVHAAAKGEQRTEITWDATADFESGISQFIVLRDGEELAKVPEKPEGKFGRPLFQSMTYHDTPSQPLPQMRYVDVSTKPGDKHTYSVVTVNSVGLKSAPAGEMANQTTDSGATSYIPFEGEKTSWHDGFDRYDYVMDEETFQIQPFKRDEDERYGVKGPSKGQRRCIVVVPKQPAPGNPWSWQGCYWDHQPQAEVELLHRGFHIAFITPDPGPQWDAWYRFLTEQHGLSKKPAFVGMSRGGYNEYTWATMHPQQVSCIYGDNPAISHESLMRLDALAKADVPLLSVVGSIDPLQERHTLAIEAIYQQFGGRMSVMVKEGAAHHPHSLHDAKPIADFIEQSVQEKRPPLPDFVGPKFTHSFYYGNQSEYRDFPRESNYLTCRGPAFGECYDRYDFSIPGVENTTAVIVPKTIAPGKPWVFRDDFVRRDAAVDLALLAKGFHIVVGPVPYNADGPNRAHWTTVYNHLVAHGFSNRPVLQGDGGAAGELYAWAIENPDKVSCIYAENPVFRSSTSKAVLLDNLAPLAKVGVPLLHLCGSEDPWLQDHTRVAEQRYKELGGQITVIVKDGEGHYPLDPKDVKPVIEFIEKAH